MGKSSLGRTILGVAVAGIVGLAAASVYALRHKIKEPYKDVTLLGDDYLDPSKEPVLNAGGVAIEIDAPAEVVWQHVKQMGQDRAG
ncbi:MAG: hypothetical protein ACI4BI_06815 [Anaerotardibacter sp.]